MGKIYAPPEHIYEHWSNREEAVGWMEREGRGVLNSKGVLRCQGFVRTAIG